MTSTINRAIIAIRFIEYPENYTISEIKCLFVLSIKPAQLRPLWPR